MHALPDSRARLARICECDPWSTCSTYTLHNVTSWGMSLYGASSTYGGVTLSFVHCKDRHVLWVSQADHETLVPALRGKGNAVSSGGVYGPETQEASGLPRVPLSASPVSVAEPVCTLL
jgi:hypothetical protein